MKIDTRAFCVRLLVALMLLGCMSCSEPGAKNRANADVQLATFAGGCFWCM